MKKLLLLGAGILFAGSISAQVIFAGMSPESIEGDYNITYGEQGGGWGNPNIEDPANAVLDTLVLYEDDGNLACDVANNGADIAGHIAIVRRGDCEFGLKVANAENAGAIACVIVNNESGDPVGMAPGTAGATVGIPVVMLSDIDGENLISEMENGPVVVFIGNKEGFYDYDIGIRKNQIIRPYYYSIPKDLAQNGEEYSLDIGAAVHNYGEEAQDDIVLNAVITLNGEELYNESSDEIELASGDSLVVMLPEFAPATWEVGEYSFEYTISSGAEDEYIGDNSVSADFRISDEILSYASYSNEGDGIEMNSTGGIMPADDFSQYSLCTHFRDANASRLAPYAISFSALKGSDAVIPSLDGESMHVKVLQWNDNFNNIEDMPQTVTSYDEIMFAEFTFDTDSSSATGMATFNSDEIIQLEDNQRYLFCVTSLSDDVYLGSDNSVNYEMNMMDTYLQPLFPVEIGDQINPAGFQSLPTHDAAVHFIDADYVSVAKEQGAIQMNAYPSPANTEITVDFKENEVSTVELINLAGQTVVFNDVQNGAQNTILNVENVESGVYFVKANLNNGMTKTMKVVVNH